VKPAFSLQALRRTKASECVFRFVFGGLVAVVAAWVGERYGPRVGGLFLAFPSLLPAALTLVKEHDGRRAAADDAKGAALGAFGLACFAVVVAATASWQAPWVSLGLALAVWIAVSVAAWWCFLKTPEAPSRDKGEGALSS